MAELIFVLGGLFTFFALPHYLGIYGIAILALAPIPFFLIFFFTNDDEDSIFYLIPFSIIVSWAAIFAIGGRLFTLWIAFMCVYIILRGLLG